MESCKTRRYANFLPRLTDRFHTPADLVSEYIVVWSELLPSQIAPSHFEHGFQTRRNRNDSLRAGLCLDRLDDDLFPIQAYAPPLQAEDLPNSTCGVEQGNEHTGR